MDRPTSEVLDYAAAPDVASTVISREFRIGTVRYWGDVVLSHDAIVLLPSRGARGYGIMALFELLADRLLPTRTLPVVPLAEAADAVGNADVLAGARQPHIGAVVVPRTGASFLLHERGKLEVRLVYNAVEIAIFHGRFGAKGIRRFAEQTGWSMFWDGEPINLPGETKKTLRVQAASRYSRPRISYSFITAGFLIGCAPMPLFLFLHLNPDLMGTLWGTGLLIAVCSILFGWIALRRGF